MPLLALKDYLCNRRVKGIRCQVKAVTFCKDHVNIQCEVCKERDALYECRSCDIPLCGQCQHHDSFGH